MDRAVLVDQPWYCEACGVHADYQHMSDLDASVVKIGVLEQHRRIAPGCPENTVPPIRFRDREKVPESRGR
jgi:hypothetical protein